MDNPLILTTTDFDCCIGRDFSVSRDELGWQNATLARRASLALVEDGDKVVSYTIWKAEIVRNFKTGKSYCLFSVDRRLAGTPFIPGRLAGTPAAPGKEAKLIIIFL